MLYLVVAKPWWRDHRNHQHSASVFAETEVETEAEAEGRAEKEAEGTRAHLGNEVEQGKGEVSEVTGERVVKWARIATRN